EMNHLRPVITYSSPSRSMRVPMLRASEEATSGSVMAKAERISPSSNGCSHCCCCRGVPNSASSSMLPVSGAAQLDRKSTRLHSTTLFRSGDEPLATGAHVFLAVPLDAGTDVARVGGGHVGLRHGEGRADLTVQQRLQPLLLLPWGAELRQQFHVAGVGCRAVGDERCDVRAAAGDLGQGGVLEIGQSRTVFAGQEQVPQSPLPGLGLELLDDRRSGPWIVGDPGLLGEDGFGGIDVLVHEREQLLAIPFGGGVVGEVHQSSLRTVFPRATSGATLAPRRSKPSPTVLPWLNR